MFVRVRDTLLVAVQVAVLGLFALGGGTLAGRLHLPIPGPIVGMALLLAALHLRIVRVEWLEAGTSFLFRHMLLFFVPAAVGAMQFPRLFGADGLRVLAVVALSTVLVMIATGFAVELAVVRRRSRS